MKQPIKAQRGRGLARPFPILSPPKKKKNSLEKKKEKRGTGRHERNLPALLPSKNPQRDKNPMRTKTRNEQTAPKGKNKNKNIGIKNIFDTSCKQDLHLPQAPFLKVHTYLTNRASPLPPRQKNPTAEKKKAASGQKKSNGEKQPPRKQSGDREPFRPSLAPPWVYSTVNVRNYLYPIDIVCT